MKFTTSTFISIILPTISVAYDWSWVFQPFYMSGCNIVDPCDNASGSKISDLETKVQSCSTIAPKKCLYQVFFDVLDPSGSIPLNAGCSGGSIDKWLAVDLRPIKAIDGSKISDKVTVITGQLDIEVTTATAATADCVFHTYQASVAPQACKAYNAGDLGNPTSVTLATGETKFYMTLNLNAIQLEEDSPAVLAIPVDDWAACGSNVISVKASGLEFYTGFYGVNGVSMDIVAGIVSAAAVTGWLLG